jgi:hypothetical protein
MIDELANRQAMHLTVIELLDDPALTPVWENVTPTAFTDKATSLRLKVTALTTKIAEQEADIQGRAVQKDREETELEILAHEIGQALADYFTDKNRESEAAEIDLSLSAWGRLRDTALLAKATLLKTRLRTAIDSDTPGVLPYGITETDHTNLVKELTDYAAVIESPSGGIATRKALTAALRPSFREVSVILKSMDRLVLRFRSTVPGKAFADNWFTARVVRNLGANNPEPPAPPVP